MTTSASILLVRARQVFVYPFENPDFEFGVFFFLKQAREGEEKKNEMYYLLFFTSIRKIYIKNKSYFDM